MAPMCGHVTSKDVVVKKQAKPMLTSSRIVKGAAELALEIQPGMILGVECASEQEPYIILKASNAVYEWQGDDEYT